MSLDTIIHAGLREHGRPTLGLVLMGGGARTAYQVGVLRALGALLAAHGQEQQPFPLQVLVGTSAGAINAAFWGFYIANFTFLVGMAAAALMPVIPVYIYPNKELHDLVIFGELFAVAAIIMAMLFVTVDLGRPNRFSHLLRRFNFPTSMLTWDLLVLNGYLLLNLHICGYLIYCAYRKREPS